MAEPTEQKISFICVNQFYLNCFEGENDPVMIFVRAIKRPKKSKEIIVYYSTLFSNECYFGSIVGIEEEIMKYLTLTDKPVNANLYYRKIEFRTFNFRRDNSADKK